MISIRVSEFNSRVFLAVSRDESNHAVGIAVREAKWASGISYADPLVCVDSVTRGHATKYTYRHYVAVPAGTPNRPYSRKRAALAVLAEG